MPLVVLLTLHLELFLLLGTAASPLLRDHLHHLLVVFLHVFEVSTMSNGVENPCTQWLLGHERGLRRLELDLQVTASEALLRDEESFLVEHLGLFFKSNLVLQLHVLVGSFVLLVKSMPLLADEHGNLGQLHRGVLLDDKRSDSLAELKEGAQRFLGHQLWSFCVRLTDCILGEDRCLLFFFGFLQSLLHQLLDGLGLGPSLSLGLSGLLCWGGRSWRDAWGFCALLRFDWTDDWGLLFWLLLGG